MDFGEVDWGSGCALPLEKWSWLNRRGCFEDENLAEFVAPFPPVRSMLKHEGIPTKELFARNGADIFEALHDASPRELGSFERILVVNCGLGRLLRMFRGCEATICACDFKAENVRWIRNSLPFVDSREFPANWKLPFEDGLFDAVIAVSYFTSLRPEAQLLLLSEIRRVASEDGLVFVSVHGRRALQRVEQEPELRKMLFIDESDVGKTAAKFEKNGAAFVSRGAGDNSKDKLKRWIADLLRREKGLFAPGSSFVSKSWVYEHWGRWFNVVDVREGAIHDFQDIVVLDSDKKGRGFFSGNTVDWPGNGKEPVIAETEALVRIRSIRTFRTETEKICEFGLENPAVCGDVSTKPFGFSGWIMGKGFRIDAVEIHAGGVLVSTIPLDIERPDVAEHFKIEAGDNRFGFSAYFNPFCLSADFEVEGFARSSEAGKTKIFAVVGDRTRFDRGFRMEIKPIVINTLGRTGSTYLLSLLGAHPQIAAYKPFQVEARYASYWTQMFLSISHPKSWVFPIASYNIEDPAWIFGDDKEKDLHCAMYPEMTTWFNGTYTRQAFGFCMGSLQMHYRRIAEIQKKEKALFFAEKFLPNPFTDAVVALVPGVKEIVLARDFRDMFCSIYAFNQKRGFLAFGRENYETDEEYVKDRLAPGIEALCHSWRRRRSSCSLVRYEDIVLQPESSLAGVFEYLGVDSSPSTVDDVLRQVARMNPKSQKHHKTTSKAKDSLRRFRREMSPELLELCNDAFGKNLKVFGYDV